MRILFSSTPAYGHLLPLLPLATAARRAGHATAALTSPSMTDVARPLDVLPAGPSFEKLLVENARRTVSGMGSPGSTVGPVEAAQFFAGTRVDVTVDEALAAATRFQPDLVVAEAADFVGPIVAAALGVQWAQHAFGVSFPESFAAAMQAQAAPRFANRGLTPRSRVAYVDPFPAFMQYEGWAAPVDHIPIRPEPFSQSGTGWTTPPPLGHPDQPLVLITFGTLMDNPDLRASVLESVRGVDVTSMVTVGDLEDPGSIDVDRSSVIPVNFVALHDLLRGVAAVVTVGGAGTVLGTLSVGIPMVILPQVPSQHWNGSRAAATGSAIVVSTAAEVGAALRAVLHDPSYALSAGRAAAQMAEVNSPDQAWALLETAYQA